ncbi:HWE histidine kinase domain-containing protein [Sphingomonas hylomeconis]|uniref:histidine kinase n=1 Tax=Sphingomonas hylomeconis TaxID=1395958 RepID=A0ABV7SXN6_9SPHN|nr:sensor histidine kinase [Sphingomonas hylomeconis]
MAIDDPRDAALDDDMEADALARMTLSEAEHRARNLISLVLALAQQSFNGLKGHPEVVAFLDRVRSLDAVARIGCEVKGDFCSLPRIAERVTTRLDNPMAPRIARTGGEVSVVARWAHLLTIVLHELTANSVRHGALSAVGGRVDLRWVASAGDNSGGAELHLHWRETGGPAVTSPGPAGFGMRLLRDLTGHNSRCQASLRLPPTGLVYALTLKLYANEVRY